MARWAFHRAAHTVENDMEFGHKILEIICFPFTCESWLERGHWSWHEVREEIREEE
jgi:hypothetical protein